MLGLQCRKSEKIRALLMLGFVSIFLLYSFIPVRPLEMIMVGTIFLLIVISFPLVKAYNKYLSLALFLLGTILLIKNEASFQDWANGLVENAGIVSLLLTVPLLGITLYYDDFQNNILKISEKYIHSEYSFFVVTIFLNNILGMLLNLASVPINHQLLAKISERYPQKLFLKAIIRGFCTNLLWSPNFVSVAVVLHYLEIPWHTIAPAGFFLAVLASILALVIERISLKTEEKPSRAKPIKANENYNIIILKLIFLIIFLVVFIIALESYTHKSVLIIVPLVSFVAPILLAVIFRKMNIFVSHFWDFFENKLPNMYNEVILFTAIGYFGYALGISSVIQYIPIIIKNLGLNTPVTLIPLFLLLIAVLSLIGVHPIIVISTIAVTLPVETIPLNEIQMAITLLAGYMMYLIISPFSALTLVNSSISQQSPLNVSLKLNYIYVILFGILTTGFLIFL